MVTMQVKKERKNKSGYFSGYQGLLIYCMASFLPCNIFFIKGERRENNMKKVLKKVMALTLAAVLTIGTAVVKQYIISIVLLLYSCEKENDVAPWGAICKNGMHI